MGLLFRSGISMTLDQEIAIFGIGVAVIAWLIKPDWVFSIIRKFWLIILLCCVALYCWHEGWLSRTLTLPSWACALIFLGFFLILIVAIKLTWRTKHLPNEPSIYDYKFDTVFGVDWLWDYHNSKLDETSLVSFCPRKSCQARLDRIDNYDGDFYSAPRACFQN
jgi:hypothetical protein